MVDALFGNAPLVSTAAEMEKFDGLFGVNIDGIRNAGESDLVDLVKVNVTDGRAGFRWEKVKVAFVKANDDVGLMLVNPSLEMPRAPFNLWGIMKDGKRGQPGEQAGLTDEDGSLEKGVIQQGDRMVQKGDANAPVSVFDGLLPS